jgi:uncharacterized protein (DUF1330 family)
MKTHFGLGLAALAGAGITAATMQMLNAQARPPGYLIADVTVTDEEGYKEYIQKFPGTLTAFGGKFLVRGGQTAPVAGGGEPPKRPVVVVFESFDKAKAWSDSDAILSKKQYSYPPRPLAASVGPSISGFPAHDTQSGE